MLLRCLVRNERTEDQLGMDMLDNPFSLLFARLLAIFEFRSRDE